MGNRLDGHAMCHLTEHDFSTFFHDIHGYAPYPWQRRLTMQVLATGGWPPVIDLPTGAGKTAVLDAAVFAMAVQPDVSPRRIVFVVDRRIVVDQVCERAERIRERIREGGTDVLQQVRERLQSLGGGELLGVACLRGGIPIDDKWAERPDQPWVMVSTVDQFGSRLLFRGYGVSQRMRPVHAGLAGNDCLVILDEVHLSNPFAQTLSRVAQLESALPRRFGVVEMSATPNNTDVARFELDAADWDSADLRPRLTAVKEAKLETVPKPDAIPAAVLKIVKSIAKSRPFVTRREDDSSLFNQPKGRSVGIVVNRVRTARETHQALQGAGFMAHLITGRMRPLDRIDVLERIRPAVAPGRGQRPEGLTIVVATQAIEVGADFSFDALITECAAVDSLRQRFGRLDRDGTGFERSRQPARAWIIGAKSTVMAKKADPIYGEAVKATWEELKRLEEVGPIDVGTSALRDFPDEASAPKDHAPLLLKTHLDAWAQTNPEPIVQPDVVHFLHGSQGAVAPDVFVVWRCDRTPETLRLIPPRQAEFLSVPIDAAKAWLTDNSEIDVADVPQAVDDSSGTSSLSLGEDWVRWTGHAKGIENVGVAEIAPGDIVVVDPNRGGLTASTWDPSSLNPVEDLGDAAQIAYGRRATLRLDSRLPYIESPPKPSEASDLDVPLSERIRDWLQERLDADGVVPGWFKEAIERLRSNPVIGVDGEDSYFLLTERNHRTNSPVVDVAVMDGSDEASSMIGSGVTLRGHMDGVGDRAERMGQRLGLCADIVADLRLAGRLHDLGKVDTRFQAQLVGGDPIEMAMQEEPLAKSLPDVRGGSSAYPRGMRHEMASVALAESNSDVLALAVDSDLVLHLVGSHHGFGRPLPAIIEDDAAQVLSYTFDGHILNANSDLSNGPQALDMADRFWRLTERYGYHGLAWLEAVLRLADHQQSAEEARR